MDLDAYSDARRPAWERLDRLVRTRRLSGAQADELVRLYQSTATDLSSVRSAAPDPESVARLSQLLARARARLAGTHALSWRDVVEFVMVTVPAALYRVRWWTVAVMTAFLVVAVAVGVLVATQPEALALMGTPAEQRDYVERAFVEYYDPGAGFAAMVWTNNAWIAAVCIGTGITGLLPAYMMLTNAVNVGAAGGLMAAHGRLDVFLQLIAPHGLLELTAIFVAGAAGLRLFWTWVDPGPRPRGRALAQEGRALFTVALGLVLVLGVSGLVEGFVTGSALPWPVKVAIGAVVLAAFWAWTIVLGGRAVRAGRTGDLEDDRAGYSVATAG
ncbi:MULTISPECIES: stage II sporulation protein M [Cellulomonas]|uniref:Membrane protein n=1 Tax=Cellulomonas oligotrophica TaxID=931536 RepID=A0A7Y9FDG4_9CELL|nr:MULTISPECIES: stage II sporulation protein M [Cellulomonas]NYD85200.1 putative membrane protein SpoIIM required for sporulation [Cellulomonas oligotrophica]TQL03703.1 putative membrane protein SpoIIM required for sporulation [Cellulomonas sp. SLBN-39]GIG34175.1 membrane protein [Cellulomonas oligotrophica]